MRDVLTKRELQVLSFHEIEKLQNQKFRATVRCLLPHVKAYVELFSKKGIDFNNVTSAEDWHKKGLPLIKKSYYMKSPKDFLVKVDKKEAAGVYFNFVKSVGKKSGFFRNLFKKAEAEKEIRDFFMLKMPVFSGGTEQGIPVPVGMTAKQKQNLREIVKVVSELVIENNFEGRETVGMNLFPYGPHLGWHAVHEAFEVGVGLNMSTAAGGAIPTQRLVRLANAYKPNIFAGMSEYFRNRFLIEAINQKITLNKEIIFVNGAEKMFPIEKERIKDLARKLGTSNITVLDLLGASELKEDLLPECHPNTGFHHISPLLTTIKLVKGGSYADENYIEHWQFTDKNGYAVIWNTGGAGTLLEGYLIGDIYDRIEKERCNKCQLNVERIHNVSRIRDVEAQLRLTGMVEGVYKGTRVNLVALREKILNLQGVAEVQVVLKKNTKEDRLSVRVAPSSRKQSPLKKIKEAIKDLEVKPKIDIIILEKLVGDDKFKFKGIMIE